MLEWWKRLSHIGKFAGIVAAITGAIVGVAAAWPLVEPYVFAHRGYVLEKVGGVQATANELLMWKFEDNRDRAKADVEDKKILLQKENDPQIKELIQKNIDSSAQKQKDYDERITKLKGR